MHRAMRCLFVISSFISLAAFGLVFGLGVRGDRVSEPRRCRSRVRGLCPRGEWVTVQAVDHGR